MRLSSSHRRARRAILASTLLALALATNAQVAPRISLEKLQAMFANMRTQTRWDIDGPMLWGYFFFDDDRARLRAAATELTGKGYRLVSIERVEGRADYRLHVEKVEIHSPQSLNARDIELEALARKYKIRSYDGMDVGPAPASASPTPASSSTAP